MENKNYYDILGVSVKATLDEITAAKNLLAKRYHPDVNMKLGVDTTEQMQEILEAYRILSDPKKRSEYDREITGRTAVMQTFDLRNEEEPEEDCAPYFCYILEGCQRAVRYYCRKRRPFPRRRTAPAGSPSCPCRLSNTSSCCAAPAFRKNTGILIL